MSGIEPTRAYVLHQRPYRETSAIVDFLSEQHGRVSAVCRGFRGSGKTALSLRANLQPFAELSLGLAGRSELKTLRSVEALHAPPPLRRQGLYAGLYLNELLLRLGRGNELCGGIYRSYRLVLETVREAGVDAGSTPVQRSLETALRRFELSIIDAIGFAVDFSVTYDTHAPVRDDCEYGYLPGQGFFEWRGTQHPDTTAAHAARQAGTAPREPLIASGATLSALAKDDFSDPLVLGFAKQLTRRALAPLLGDRPMKTRELYA